MDTEALKELVAILGDTSGDVVGLLWAFVVLQYLYAAFEAFCVVMVGWGFVRAIKFAVKKEVWKYMT